MHDLAYLIVEMFQQATHLQQHFFGNLKILLKSATNLKKINLPPFYINL